MWQETIRNGIASALSITAVIGKDVEEQKHQPFNVSIHHSIGRSRKLLYGNGKNRNSELTAPSSSSQPYNTESRAKAPEIKAQGLDVDHAYGLHIERRGLGQSANKSEKPTKLGKHEGTEPSASEVNARKEDTPVPSAEALRAHRMKEVCDCSGGTGQHNIHTAAVEHNIPFTRRGGMRCGQNEKVASTRYGERRNYQYGGGGNSKVQSRTHKTTRVKITNADVRAQELWGHEMRTKTPINVVRLHAQIDMSPVLVVARHPILARDDRRDDRRYSWSTGIVSPGISQLIDIADAGQKWKPVVGIVVRLVERWRIPTRGQVKNGIALVAGIRREGESKPGKPAVVGGHIAELFATVDEPPADKLSRVNQVGMERTESGEGVGRGRPGIGVDWCHQSSADRAEDESSGVSMSRSVFHALAIPAEDDDEYDFSPIRRHTPVYPSYTPYPSYASTGYTYPSSTKASFVQAHPPPAHAYNSPTTSSSSSPSSVDSAESALSAAARSTRSAFDDRACRVFKRRRWSHDGPPLSHRDLSDVADDEDAASPILHEDLDDEEDAGEDTRVQQENKPRPTCTHALRREWQTLCLRVEFRIFHLQRRIRSIRESRRRAGVGG
ncbi:hypothetical protein FISHEDRAFT_60027 [Fistulina hepatica ATCC 64428]|uniref:Uncharacterized protein n=1 Tax=Fistulina hepatica ATCC 64428 TaxID=1128425 RepID=A0A0D7A7U6_9AGAR|nr:hypothetical protein FISHEDRAFT_60027 [Fistulina hepatica ATCC 64428]